MAYFNPNTYEIYAGSNIDGFLDGFVEIDEVIAPLIRILNLRGYKTEYCCSGHPLSSVDEIFTDIADAENAFADTLRVEKSIKEKLPYRVIIGAPASNFYISFVTKRERDFPYPLPDGFTWESDSVIRYHYVCKEFYAFLEERLLAANALHRWALRLPTTEL